MGVSLQHENTAFVITGMGAASAIKRARQLARLLYGFLLSHWHCVGHGFCF